MDIFKFGLQFLYCHQRLIMRDKIALLTLTGSVVRKLFLFQDQEKLIGHTFSFLFIKKGRMILVLIKFCNGWFDVSGSSMNRIENLFYFILLKILH